MGKYCSDCTYLSIKDKKCDGCYKCSKTKKYTFGNIPACDKFSNAYSRGWYEKEKIYDDGKIAANKSNSKPTSIIAVILLIIIAIIVNLFFI